MKKLITLITVISLTAISYASADVRAGVSVAWTELSTDGSEKLKDAETTEKKSVSNDVMIPAIFLEVGSSDRGLYIGVDYTDVASLGQKSRDDSASVAGTNRGGVNTASADVDSLTSVYAIKTLGDSGLFVKVGYAQADVITKENLTSGSTYGNASVSGILVGAGLHKEDDSGYFFRASAEYIDYDSISLTGTEAGGTTTSFNTITADVDSTALKISVGKTF